MSIINYIKCLYYNEELKKFFEKEKQSENSERKNNLWNADDISMLIKTSASV